MNTKEIKQFIKATFGLKTVRVTSTLTKSPYFTAWIPSDNRHLIHGPLTYSSEFPVEFREMALNVIYGPAWKSLPGRAGNAGNVNAHSIGMKEFEWNALCEKWKSLDTVPNVDMVTA